MQNSSEYATIKFGDGTHNKKLHITKYRTKGEKPIEKNVIVTDEFGKEIGDWNWSWTQIKCTKQLEPNTDYVFRFAMTGGYNDTNDAISQFIIFEDNNWDDRFTYPLDKSRFKPLFSKRDESGLLRVYEIPFTTGETGNVTMIIVAQHAVARFMPALDNEAYSEMEDFTYEQWWAERNKSFETGENSNSFSSWRNINLSGAVISSGRMLKKILEKVPFGANIDLSGAVIDDNGDDDDFDDDDFTKSGMNEAIERIRAQYEAAPEGSAEKFALKEALETLQIY